MSLKAKTENLLALAVALLLANTLGVKAQAPDSISGRSFGIGVSGGLYPYASYGYFLFLPSTLGRSYQIIPIYAVTGSSGTYAYSQTGIDTAAATVLDPINGQQSAQFTFSSPHSGSYYVTSSSFPGAYQTGEFEMYSGTVPDSIAGKTVLGSVQDGLYPLASGGTFTFKAASSGNTFVSVGDGVNTGNSSGTFSYSKLNSTTGVLRIHSSSGDTTTYLACTTSTEGGYATVSAGGGFQIGHFIILDAQNPKITVTSPKSGARSTSPIITIQGTASDDVEVASVWYQVNAGAWLQASGTTTWTATSDAQPGSNTVSAYCVDTGGKFSPIITVRFSYVVMSPLTLIINGQGSVSPNLAGQLLEVGRSYSITAKPGSGYVFSGWSGDRASSALRLTFVMGNNMQLGANFISNPFAPIARTYQGLFYHTNGASNQDSGRLSGTVRNTGAFTAKIQMLGRSYSFSGTFTPDGAWSNSVPRKGLNPLSVELHLDMMSGDTLSGLIGDGVLESEVFAIRGAYSAKGAPAPQMGRYTLMIPGSAESATSPGGYGFATAVVTASGNVNLSGALGDGMRISQSAILSKEGMWPLYISGFADSASIFGWLTFTNETETDIAGSLDWIKISQAGTGLYPAGFTNHTSVLGSAYQFRKNIPLLNLTTGQVWLANGGLTQSFTNTISLDAKNKIANLSSNKLTLNISTSSGLFKGSIVSPDTGKSIPISGVLLQKQNLGIGYFFGPDQTGSVTLEQ